MGEGPRELLPGAGERGVYNPWTKGLERDVAERGAVREWFDGPGARLVVKVGRLDTLPRRGLPAGHGPSPARGGGGGGNGWRARRPYGSIPGPGEG
jgi:hypothetical protein